MLTNSMIKYSKSSQDPRVKDLSIPTREFNFRGLAKCVDNLNWNAWLSPNWMRSFRLSFVYWTDWKLMFVSKCRNYSNLKAKIEETFIWPSWKASPEGDHDALDLQIRIHVFYTLVSKVYWVRFRGFSISADPLCHIIYVIPITALSLVQGSTHQNQKIC